MKINPDSSIPSPPRGDQDTVVTNPAVRSAVDSPPKLPSDVQLESDPAAESEAASVPSKRLESNLSAAVMRSIVGAGASNNALPADTGAWGGGGITHEPPVADPIRGEGYTSQVKQDLIEGLRKVYDSPEFQHLNAADRKYVLDTLSANPPLTQEKIANTLALLKSAHTLSPADQKLALEGFRAAHANPTYAANLKSLIEDPKFTTMPAAEKTAVLSQTKNYPDPRSVANIQRMLQKDWFTAEPLDDKQRSLKTIARLSQDRPNTDRAIIDHTLDKFIGAGSDYKLDWKQYPPGNELFYGQGGGKILHLNKGLVAADNNKMVENEDTDHLTFNTVTHEVNHLMNRDVVADTFHYFESEYRAWYVGFQAQNGRVPTNQEAMEQRIKFQFDPDSFYGKHAAEAMKDPVEARQFFSFLHDLTGETVDASNWQTVLNSDPATWKNLSESPAPVPSGNIDNH